MLLQSTQFSKIICQIDWQTDRQTDRQADRWAVSVQEVPFISDTVNKGLMCEKKVEEKTAFGFSSSLSSHSHWIPGFCKGERSFSAFRPLTEQGCPNLGRTAYPFHTPSLFLPTQDSWALIPTKFLTPISALCFNPCARDTQQCDERHLLFPSRCITGNYWISPMRPLGPISWWLQSDSQALKSFHVIKK